MATQTKQVNTRQNLSVSRNDKPSSYQPPPDYSVLRYDYTVIEEAHRRAVQDAALAIHQWQRRMAEDTLRLGAMLLEVKAILPHGKFAEWWQQEFDLSTRVIQGMMNAATVYGDPANARRVAHLSDGAIYLLAAPSTPPEARAAIEAEIEASGQAPTRAQVKRAIDAYKPPKPPRQIAAAPPLQLTDSRTATVEPPPDAAYQAGYKAGFDAAYNEYGPEEPAALDLEGNLDFDDAPRGHPHTIEAEYSVEPEQKPTGKYAERLARAVALRNVLLEMEAEQDGYFLDEVKRVRDPLKLLIYKLERKLR